MPMIQMQMKWQLLTSNADNSNAKVCYLIIYFLMASLCAPRTDFNASFLPLLW